MPDGAESNGDQRSGEQMEISKLKLEIYDFLGIVIPGLLLLAEILILVKGWSSFIETVDHLNGIGLTLLILLSFGIGNIVQELGDVTMKTFKDKRYARAARDKFWHTKEAGLVKNKIKKECGFEIEAVDTAYDYCLTKIRDLFPKRDLFVAVSDMCRSLLVLSALAILPVFQVVFRDSHLKCPLATFLGVAVLLAAICGLALARMSRFRFLSEVTVFHVYLASSCDIPPKDASSPAAKGNDSED